MTGDLREARSRGQHALTLAEAVGDFRVQASATFCLGAACLALGNYRRAEELLVKAAQSAEGELIRERFGAGYLAVFCRWALVFALVDRGAFEEGIAHAQEGVRIARAVEHPYSMSIASQALAYLYAGKGELSQAVSLLESDLALIREYNLTILVLPGLVWVRN